MKDWRKKEKRLFYPSNLESVPHALKAITVQLPLQICHPSTKELFHATAHGLLYTQCSTMHRKNAQVITALEEKFHIRNCNISKAMQPSCTSSSVKLRLAVHLSFDAICLIRRLVSFSILFTSCECSVRYCKHTWSSVTLTCSLPSQCRYFIINRVLKGSARYNLSAALANSSHEVIKVIVIKS